MGIFNSKPKLNIEQFCNQFYDRHIFHFIFDNKDFYLNYTNHLHQMIVQAEPSFANIGLQTFHEEFKALNIEIFGLAWTHKFCSNLPFCKDEFLFAEISFTHSYLLKNEHQHVWDIIADYNKAIGESCYAIVQNKDRARQRAWFTYLNTAKFELFCKRTEQGRDPKFSGRIGNRMISDGAWQGGFTSVYLTDILKNRLGYETKLNNQMLSIFTAAISNMYKVAKDEITRVKLHL
jgi:hypothetical protein